MVVSDVTAYVASAGDGRNVAWSYWLRGQAASLSLTGARRLETATPGLAGLTAVRLAVTTVIDRCHKLTRSLYPSKLVLVTNDEEGARLARLALANRTHHPDGMVAAELARLAYQAGKLRTMVFVRGPADLRESQTELLEKFVVKAEAALASADELLGDHK